MHKQDERTNKLIKDNILKKKAKENPELYVRYQQLITQDMASYECIQRILHRKQKKQEEEELAKLAEMFEPDLDNYSGPNFEEYLNYSDSSPDDLPHNYSD
eukprot:Phypoly_transcript_19026.p1 GENE.Phypoly_transcript_19026~~Phypoly_transcript_19026.p1  ORF type:complete len:101 (+),score=25.82 Phypoly_transcript_19026:48-350(+)